MATIEDMVESVRIQANYALELYKKGDKAEACMLIDEVAEEACKIRDEIEEEVLPTEWDAALEKKISNEPKAKV